MVFQNRSMADSILSRIRQTVSSLFSAGQRGRPLILHDYNAIERAWNGRPIASEYLGIPSVLAGLRLICETVAGLPLHYYHRQQDGGRNRAENQVAADAFKYFEGRNEFELRSSLMFRMLAEGVAYARVWKNQANEAYKLQEIPGDCIIEKVDEITGSKVYGIKSDPYQNDAETWVPERDMFILKGSFNGNSLLELCQGSLELTKAAQEYGSTLYANGARPSGVLTHPGKLSDDARRRLRSDFEKLHTGLANAGRIAVLEEGLSFTPTSTSPEDAQAIQTREFQVREVCRVFGIPPAKMGLAGGGESIEAQNIQFLTDCIQPHLVRFEQECNRKLVRESDWGWYTWSHSVEGLLRADILTRYKSYSIGRNWGWLSVNQIRKLESWDPIPGGDVFLSPTNMQPLTDTAPGARAPAADQAVDSVDQYLADPQPAQDQPAPVDSASQQSAQDIASLALNGAQVTALVDLALKVTAGLLQKEAALALAQAAFPSIPQTTLDKIFGNILPLSPAQLDAGQQAVSQMNG